MPRCYMVKKDPSPLGGTPPCSPTEASVAPPCYTPHDHHTVAGPRPAQYAEPPRHVGTQYEEPRSGDFAEESGGENTDLSGNTRPEHNGIFTVLRAAQYADHPERASEPWRAANPVEPRCADYAEPRTVRYLERDLSQPEPRVAEYAEPRTPEPHDTHPTEYEVMATDGAHLTDYRVDGETGVGVGDYQAGEGEEKVVEYAELQNMDSAVPERSAADTEAAHELLSLAAGVPPLPPATVLTVLSAPEPVLPLYTYALQPTSIYIIADEPATNNLYTTTVQTLTPLQQVEYTVQPQVSTYIIQEPVASQPTLQYQPVYATSESGDAGGVGDVGEVAMDAGVPVSVAEAAPVAEPAPAPLSVQVPVIEPVPQQPPPPAAPEPAYDTDSDENVPLINNVKKNKYNCNECGKRYATSSNLSRHKQTHRSLDSQAAKRCGECGKAYVSMPALAMHVLTHRMGYVCGVCGKQFSRPWLLRGHLRSHTGEKPYNCPSCNKSFADRSNLRAHLQTHTSDKRWECTRCNKTFALKSYLNKHQEAACSQDEHEPN